ncbi:hypothetical protein LK540_04690 [Massilia sp. IC2-278]|uniref:hypothetical protein n=1 Tax=Massilia sp. IC2-278 TaxID=2887200 RepID=UPI001E44CBB7|nr:hypothetical protein [Massilia sp. IC2-278]MCC2959727.1 hypothetical protein [Massilia sp. IC2-278]
MGFTKAPCTEQVFDALRLPASLHESESLNPIGRDLIHDLAACSALIPHPFHYSEYPDRQLSFYLRGQCFRAWEYVTRPDDLDRVEVSIGDGVDEATCGDVANLLAQAVGLMRNEAAASIPVKLLRKEAPRVRVPRSPAEIIPKLNTLAEHYVRLKHFNAEEVAVAALIGVVLLPEEVAPLERHLQEFGWDELVPDVRELVATALARVHGTAHSTASGTATPGTA